MLASRKSLLVIAFALSFLIGFIVIVASTVLMNRQETIRLDDRTVNQTLPHSLDTASFDNSDETALQDGSLLAVFIPLIHIESRFDRQVAIDRILKTTNSSVLLEILHLTKNLAHSQHRAFIQTNVLRKLASINPQLALLQVDKFSNVQRHAYLVDVLYEWSYTDIDALINQAKVMNLSDRLVTLSTLVQYRDDLSETKIREIGITLKLEEQTEGMLRERHFKSLPEKPKESFFAFIGDDIDDKKQINDLEMSAKAWLMRDGIDVLSQIRNSLQPGQIRREVLSSGLSYQMTINPQKTFEIASKVLDFTDRAVLELLARYWAERDPITALNTVSHLNSNDIRHELQKTVVQVWAKSRPEEIVGRLDLVPDYLRSNAQRDAFELLTTIASPHSLEVLANTLDGEQDLASTLVTKWIKKNAQQAISWVLTNPKLNENSRGELLRDAIVALSGERADEAFKLARTLPTDEAGVGPEVHVVSSLVSTDLERAIAMLPRVREGPTKLSAYLTIGSELVIHDSDHAFNLGLELSGSHKSVYFGTIVGNWFIFDSEAACASIDSLPNPEAKSAAAYQILLHDRIVENLSDVQKTQISHYLQGEDVNVLDR